MLAVPERCAKTYVACCCRTILFHFRGVCTSGCGTKQAKKEACQKTETIVLSKDRHAKGKRRHKPSANAVQFAAKAASVGEGQRVRRVHKHLVQRHESDAVAAGASFRRLPGRAPGQDGEQHGLAQQPPALPRPDRRRHRAGSGRRSVASVVQAGAGPCREWERASGFFRSSPPRCAPLRTQDMLSGRRGGGADCDSASGSEGQGGFGERVAHVDSCRAVRWPQKQDLLLAGIGSCARGRVGSAAAPRKVRECGRKRARLIRVVVGLQCLGPVRPRNGRPLPRSGMRGVPLPS